jgi:hypothetical protein
MTLATWTAAAAFVVGATSLSPLLVADPGSPSQGGVPLSEQPATGVINGQDLALCLGDWDPGTHMSKSEWRRVCERTQGGTTF